MHTTLPGMCLNLPPSPISDFASLQEKHELRKWLDNVKGPHIILFTAPWHTSTSWSNEYLLGQWLNFKLFGITYLVGKISRSNFFFQGPLAE